MSIIDMRISDNWYTSVIGTLRYLTVLLELETTVIRWLLANTGGNFEARVKLLKRKSETRTVFMQFLPLTQLLPSK